MYKDENGNKIHNARIRFIQSTNLPSDDEGSASEEEEETEDEEESSSGSGSGSEYETETDTDSEGEEAESDSPEPIQYHDEIDEKEEKEGVKGVRIHINKPGGKGSDNAFLPFLKAMANDKSNSSMNRKSTTTSPYLQVTPSKHKLEESPEIRFYSDEEEEDDHDVDGIIRQTPNVSRYNSSEYYTNSSIASGSESEDGISKRILGTRRFSASKPMMRKPKRRLSF
eukprot:CAMPEP_0201596266 /NCGR_PEP_ID=MMETSP0190_2-20130828/193004_1 /ASSEMBLY_ACC=CAM_ASM_000263 /TAXON_ID=37353 /ORGANISM="Rosalina sp." /LENGTH=225 /DNA_ID=CAMNT_0048056555 /DNA_START=1333 /DNA_END=2010 /DNA_ORIENTATION=-